MKIFLVRIEGILLSDCHPRCNLLTEKLFEIDRDEIAGTDKPKQITYETLIDLQFIFSKIL